MKLIAKALIEAQKEMGNAVKDSKNPFFKSLYADLNSVREACIPALNKYSVVVLQPICQVEGKSYVKTLLLHESGESIESLTEIVYSKIGDAQAQGSGITYARRYGLQSLVCIGAEDDDGNKASVPAPAIDDVRVGAENYFKQFKVKLEDCDTSEGIDELWGKEEARLKKLEKGYKDLYDRLVSCKNDLKTMLLIANELKERE